jgi:type II secretory pathway component PulF
MSESENSLQPGSGEAAGGLSAESAQQKRFRIVAIVAGILYFPQVASIAIIPTTVMPTFQTMFSDMGGELPQPTAFIVNAGLWFPVLILAIGVGIYSLFYWLARKYWIGLLFAPLFTNGFILGPIITALYLPMFQVITLVD